MLLGSVVLLYRVLQCEHNKHKIYYLQHDAHSTSAQTLTVSRLNMLRVRTFDTRAACERGNKFVKSGTGKGANASARTKASASARWAHHLYNSEYMFIAQVLGF